MSYLNTHRGKNDFRWITDLNEKKKAEDLQGNIEEYIFMIYESSKIS